MSEGGGGERATEGRERDERSNLSSLVLNAYLLAIKAHQEDSSLDRTLACKLLRTSEPLLPMFCVWRERMEG